MRGELYDFSDRTLTIKNRIVGGFKPKIRPIRLTPSELSGLELTSCQVGPEVWLLNIEVKCAEQFVMLSPDVFKTISKRQ